MRTPELSIRLRPINDLEFQLYRSFTKPAVDWANQNQLAIDDAIEAEQPMPAELIRLVNKARTKIEHIGFVMTTAGLMIRDEPDILNENAELAAIALKEYEELLKRI